MCTSTKATEQCHWASLESASASVGLNRFSSIVSLGYIGRGKYAGWRGTNLNPSKSRVTTYEVLDNYGVDTPYSEILADPLSLIRGGSANGDHVDVLGKQVFRPTRFHV